MIKKALFAGCFAALLSSSFARADTVLSGDVTTTGGTFAITQNISYTIKESGSIVGIVFDNWVTSDGTQSIVQLTPAFINYQINGGTIQSVGINFLFDNVALVSGDLSPNDGYLYFSDIIAITQSDVITFLSGTWTTAANSQFNPEAIQTFRGDSFLVDPSSHTLSEISVVPEPSTWAVLGGLGALGLVFQRRRKS